MGYRCNGPSDETENIFDWNSAWTWIKGNDTIFQILSLLTIAQSVNHSSTQWFNRPITQSPNSSDNGPRTVAQKTVAFRPVRVHH